MGQLHRVQWIDLQVRLKKYPNCSTIAGHFEISRRQAARDIEYLRYSLGAPLEYDSSRGGYVYRDESFAIPSLFISEQQKQRLSYMASVYRYAASPDMQQMGKLFSQLAGSQDRGYTSLPRFYLVNPSESQVFQVLERAIHLSRKVRMEYVNAQKSSGNRVVHPYRVMESDARRFLMAFCEKRSEPRLFRLDRIQKIEMLEELFQWPSREELETFRAKTFSKDFRKPYVALLRVEPGKLPPIPRGNAGPVLEMVELGNEMYQCFFFRSAELFSWMIQVPGRVHIVSPGWLKEKWKAVLHKALRQKE